MARVSPPTVTVFEQTCRDLNTPATQFVAEKQLTHFQESDTAIATAVSVIESSTESIARFHAARILRHAAVRHWSILPPPQRFGPDALRMLAVRAATNPTIGAAERTGLVVCAAVLFRRAFMEEGAESQLEFLASLREAAVGRSGNDPVAAATASEFFMTLADEFLSPGKLDGVESEMMARTRPLFLRGDGHIVYLFRTAVETVQSALAAGGDPTAVARKCCPALELLGRALTSKLTSEYRSGESADADADIDYAEMVVLRLDASWRPLVDQLPAAIHAAFGAVAFAKGCPQLPPDAGLHEAGAHVILAACTISRKSFGNIEGAREVLRLILSGVESQQWISSMDPSERATYVEVWRQLAFSHKLEGLSAFGEEPFTTFANNSYSELRRCSEEMLGADQDEVMGIMDTADQVLETWAQFAREAGGMSAGTKAFLEPMVARVFAEYVQMAVRSIHLEKLPAGSAAMPGVREELEEEDMGFDDASTEESRKNAAAALARFAWTDSCILLVNVLNNRVERAYGDRRVDDSLLAVLLEDVVFLVELAAAVLADDTPGEVPSVPDAIAGYVSPNVESVGFKLFDALLGTSKAETSIIARKGAHADEASPRVGRVILESFDRVAKTYLVPTENHQAAFAVIGGEQVASEARVLALNKALEALRLRSFDPEISHAMARLLQTLAAGALRYVGFQMAEEWRVLLHLDMKYFLRLSTGVVEGIATAITTALADAVADQLVIPASQQLLKIVSANEEVPEAAEICLTALHLLKGVVGCQNVGAKPLIVVLEAMAANGPVVRAALYFQPHRYDVMRTCVSLADDLVVGRLSMASRGDAVRLLSSSIHLVEQYTASIVSYGEKVPEDEVKDAIKQVIQLLGHILDEGLNVSLSDLLFRGLQSLLPCLTKAFLEEDLDIKAGYFAFIAGLVSAYPQKVLTAPWDFFNQIIQSLQMELSSAELNGERRSLEAVAALARELSTKSELNDANPRIEEALIRLLDSILTGVCMGSAFTDNLGAAAEAILPLIFLNVPRSQEHFETIGKNLMLRGGNAPKMGENWNKLREAAVKASVHQGFKNQPVPPDTEAKQLQKRRLASKEFKEAVLEFSVHSRDVFLRLATGS